MKNEKNQTHEMFSERIKDIPVQNIDFAEWNYKEQNNFVLGKLKANLSRNGQVENLIVREIGTNDSGEKLYECVNGNHRLEALIALGIETAACYDLGKISEARAKRIAVETNETRFKTNEVKLGGLLEEATKEWGFDDVLETTPYDEAHLEKMMSLSPAHITDDPALDPSKMEDAPAPSDSGGRFRECPKCGHEF